MKTETVDVISMWAVGLGVVTIALFPLALPILILTLVALLPLLIPVLVIAGLAAPLLLVRRLLRGRGGKPSPRREPVAGPPRANPEAAS